MFAIPTLKESVERARRAFRSHLPGADAWIWPNNVNPTAKVFGGIQHEIFGFADYTARQKFALTADSENLDLHGEELGLARRPASPASGIVTIAFPDAVEVANAARLRRADGAEYLVTIGGALATAGTLNVTVIAAADGLSGNAIDGTPLEIVSGVTGAGADDALASVAGGIVGGLDVEGDEDFRARILFRKRNPPHGGAPADYVMWTSEVSGVTRVFVERHRDGPGTLRVYPLFDDLYLNGLPQPADVARVADHLAALAPAGAVITVLAAEAVPVNIQIGGLTPATSDVQDAVRADLRDAFRNLSRVAGVDQNVAALPFLATPTSFSVSWIWQAVANATGEQRHRIVSPVNDIALTPGQMATLGTVTFVP